jgi:hypothetical protein
MNSSRQKGQACGRNAKNDYQSRGYQTVDIWKGAGFLAIKPGKQPALVEAKYCSGRLTPTQRETKELVTALGWDYYEYRCACDTE